jgi:hypothetical protein
MINRSAYLIANNIFIEESLPFSVGSNVLLRRPSEIELHKIREVLQSSSASVWAPWVPYEAVITTNENDGLSFKHIDNPAEWHYYVLSDDKGGSLVHELEAALLLLDESIELSVRVVSTFDENSDSECPTMFGYGPPGLHIIERYHQGSAAQRKRMSLADLQLANEIRGKLASLGEELEFIRHAAKMLKELRQVSFKSRLQVIGFFSIIETLVTHQPRLTESLDSINHQLTGKLRLLTNRMGCYKLLTDAFGEHSDAKLWKKLYGYRSAIAHGKPTSFEGEFSILKTDKNVVEALSAFTRKLLRYALEESRLFADLKEC